MVLVTNNWRIWMAGMAASLVIFGVLFFAVIQPSENTANQAVTAGMHQTQQVLKQAQKQLGSANGQASGASAQAKTQLSKVQKLTACVTAAGTDPTKLQGCQSKYGG